MNTNLDDPKIEQLFKQLREEDETEVPFFHEVLNAPRAPRWNTLLPVFRYSAAAASVLLLVISAPLLLEFASPPVDLGPEPIAALYDWQSPTSFLMEVPEDQLVTTLPELETGAVGWNGESTW